MEGAVMRNAAPGLRFGASRSDAAAADGDEALA